MSARYQNRYAWCVDQYWSNPLVELEYNKVDDSEMPDELAIERYYESKTFRSTNLENQNSLLWLMKMLAIIVIRFVRNFFRSGRKSGQYMLAEQIKIFHPTLSWQKGNGEKQVLQNSRRLPN